MLDRSCCDSHPLLTSWWQWADTRRCAAMWNQGERKCGCSVKLYILLN
jgi:hypothetical protein